MRNAAEPTPTTRRHFLLTASSALAALSAPLPRVLAQGNPIRPDVAAIDHDRILRSADQYLTDQPIPITSLSNSHSPGGPHDYFSEIVTDEANEVGSDGEPKTYTAHRDALFSLGLRVSSLTAAQWLTNEAKYGETAARHLRAWFISPSTRLTPALNYAGVPVSANQGPDPSNQPRTGTYAGVIEALPLVEIAQAIPFLAAAGSLTSEDLLGLRNWFAAYLSWLTADQDSGPRLAALARDHKDHHATSWMLQAAAYTLLTSPDTGAPRNESHAMTDLRHRFRSVTLRTQVAAEGMFRNEISTPDPYRNSLFNLDLMGCLCQLLSTRFESAWDYQLEDGPGMRVAVAYHFPFIQNRAKWPYRADARFFSDLPSRRPSLLFAARAFQRPEYASLWKSLQPDPEPLEIKHTIPIHQPLLWVVQPHRAPAQAQLGSF